MRHPKINCPNAFTILASDRFSDGGRMIIAACDRYGCHVCGPVIRQEKLDRVQINVHDHQWQLTVSESSFHRELLVRRLKYHGSLKYITVEHLVDCQSRFFIYHEPIPSTAKYENTRATLDSKAVFSQVSSLVSSPNLVRVGFSRNCAMTVEGSRRHALKQREPRFEVIGITKTPFHVIQATTLAITGESIIPFEPMSKVALEAVLGRLVNRRTPSVDFTLKEKNSCVMGRNRRSVIPSPARVPQRTVFGFDVLRN